MPYLTGIITSFLVAFPALFSIVNPFGGALIYSQITIGRTHAERRALAWRVATYSAIVMLVSLLIGATLMSFFGVSIDALRVAGGTVVAVSGWRMLYNPQETEDRKQDQASDANRATAWSSEVAFFPLTMPFTTGPGTISVAIALSANRPREAAELLPFFAGICGAAIILAVIIGACYSSADRLVALLGPGRARILTRLSAFLLLCIGVQILITGIQGALVSVLSTAH
ncbi:MarC family protein [Hyphomicrobium sp.]|jgi:multiple antibiotic resistance protein|uniref:MarC family protein n=1 Tax=Hyphomicrobium sp. TaxID=82 RepID=UPI003568DAA1